MKQSIPYNLKIFTRHVQQMVYAFVSERSKWRSFPRACRMWSICSVINFLNTKHFKLSEIHRQLVEVAENVMIDGIVRKWVQKFSDGRISVHDEEQGGWLLLSMSVWLTNWMTTFWTKTVNNKILSDKFPHISKKGFAWDSQISMKLSQI